MKYTKLWRTKKFEYFDFVKSFFEYELTKIDDSFFSVSNGIIKVSSERKFFYRRINRSISDYYPYIVIKKAKNNMKRGVH